MRDALYQNFREREVRHERRRLVAGSFIIGGILGLGLLWVILFGDLAFSQECPAASTFPRPGACSYVSYGDGILGPDPTCTPGEAVVGDVAALCSEKQTRRCKPDKELRRALLRAYDVPGMGEADHLIPLCLGGSNGAKNLWPQQRFKAKDRLEAKLCRNLCEGKITLEAARVVILNPKNWK